MKKEESKGGKRSLKNLTSFFKSFNFIFLPLSLSLLDFWLIFLTAKKDGERGPLSMSSIPGSVWFELGKSARIERFGKERKCKEKKRKEKRKTSN